jgi:probable rRNA maturation factor
MKLTLEINNLSKGPTRSAFFNDIAKKTLENSDYKFLKNKNISVSLAIVSKKEIKKLNKTYRRKNEPTDVLSFGEFRSFRELRAFRGREVFLGEVILCYDYIKEYAKKRGLVFKKELATVFAHGLLHLLGMRHGEGMFKAQNKIEIG